MTACGTYAGPAAHDRAGTPRCEDCKRAATEYQAARRFRTGFQRDPWRCSGCGSVFREHRCSALGDPS
jgi:hypothetical protein